MLDPQSLITDRLRAIDASGIRRVFDLAADLHNPINLSIGQPHFDVPEPIRRAAIEAIDHGQNRYTVTQGIGPLNEQVRARIENQFPQWARADYGSLIISGVSGGLLLALMTCVQPGDEVIMADPGFMMYWHLVTLAGGKSVFVDTYPDFKFTAERIEPLITDRTKLLIVNSPSNPTGVVLTDSQMRDIVDLAKKHDLLILTDEIYDVFCYEKVNGLCPSPAAYETNLLLLRGFSKTWAMTGWRLGYAVGPREIINEMTKLQQYSFVCAPSMAQAAGLVALDVDMSEYVEQYRRKRDRVVERLSGLYDLTVPGGAFYAFVEVPPKLGLSGEQFVKKAIAHNLLIIPGSVFSQRDTHFRISYACDDAMLDQGLDLLCELAQ